MLELDSSLIMQDVEYIFDHVYKSV